MKLPRDLCGRDLAATLCRHWGYRQVNQVGTVGFNDLDHEADDGARREKLAALLTLAARELGEEVFVDLAEEIAGGVGRDVGEGAQELLGQGLVDARKRGVVVLGQNAIKLGFVFLDGFHRFLEPGSGG